MTESELIRADDAMPQMLWMRYLLEAQGYGIEENVLYRDKMSAILLENNSKKSITKNKKHNNVRYYFIKYRVESGEVIIEHCPRTKILGDHFTKPLQGVLFRKFRAEIMNISDDLDMDEMGMDGAGIKKGVMWKIHNETDPGFPQECVGDYENLGGRDGAEDRSDGRVGRVRADIYDSVILKKRERSWEVRSYNDLARENIEMPLGK